MCWLAVFCLFEMYHLCSFSALLCTFLPSNLWKKKQVAGHTKSLTGLWASVPLSLPLLLSDCLGIYFSNNTDNWNANKSTVYMRPHSTVAEDITCCILSWGNIFKNGPSFSFSAALDLDCEKCSLWQQFYLGGARGSSFSQRGSVCYLTPSLLPGSPCVLHRVFSLFN